MAKSVEDKKVVEKKAKKEEGPKMLGTSDVAKKLGVDPKFFRTVLRANDMGANGQRYQWKLDDPLKKEKRLIEDYREKQEERKANAAEKEKEEKSAKPSKKAEKKVSKANGKKVAKKQEEEEESEAEEEEVFEEA